LFFSRLSTGANRDFGKTAQKSQLSKTTEHELWVWKIAEPVACRSVKRVLFGGQGNPDVDIGQVRHQSRNGTGPDSAEPNQFSETCQEFTCAR
jgi:hypothetical protein